MFRYDLHALTDASQAQKLTATDQAGTILFHAVRIAAATQDLNLQTRRSKGQDSVPILLHRAPFAVDLNPETFSVLASILEQALKLFVVPQYAASAAPVIMATLQLLKVCLVIYFSSTALSDFVYVASVYLVSRTTDPSIFPS